MDVNFNVSARTALLIGRESIPSSNGAIGEIVKNAYDADSTKVIVSFDLQYEEVPKIIDAIEFYSLIERYSQNSNFDKKVLNVVKENYEKQEKQFILSDHENVDNENLIKFFNNFNSITFIDNGCGMDIETIKKYWMTIGTHNKLRNSETPSGRLTVGSKGIGRFSLDKLGEICEMYTKKAEKKLVKWKINWNEFEKENAKITDVKASLDELESDSYQNQVRKKLCKLELLNKTDYSEFETGTIIKISSLRELWNENRLGKVRGDLLSLIPINIFNEFKIFFNFKQNGELSSEIKRPILSDYDYRVRFELKDSNIKVKILRDEFNYGLMNSGLKSEVKNNLNKSYGKYNLIKESLDETIFDMSVDDILDPEVEKKNITNIGDFKFEFDYFKQSSTRKDSKKFYYKTFNSSSRRNFLSENSGIKIYRDGFRVRPYGEKDSFSYDWLGLGIKATTNPAAITHKGGSWNVRPNQIFGRVDISRNLNPKLADNASRQGIDLSAEFEALVKLLRYFIKIFEKDRVAIATTILKFDWELHEKEEDEKVAKSVIEKVTKDKPISKGENKKLVASYKQKEEEIKALNYELNILKSYSTSSMFTRVFSHEIKTINNNLASQTQQMEPMLKRCIDPNSLENIKARQNPFKNLELIKSNVETINSYIKIMTSNYVKDKRKRSDVNMKEYFEKYQKNWSSVLKSRNIEIQMTSENFKFRCFSFDLFSIITNLIINSADAFLEEKFTGERKIDVNANIESGVLILTYSDSGPGLDNKIKNPYEIFEESFTTKKHGTGMGMWILQTLVNEYQGALELENVRNGFNIVLKFSKGVKLID